MGRWAQARRRGGRPGAATGPGPPPAPLLHDIVGALVQTAQGLDDTGATLELLRGDSTGGPYYHVDYGVWVLDWNWGEIDALDPGFYVCTETGNGTRYVGVSALSNEYHKP